MIRHLNKNYFIEMPWKNGKGKTLELFRFPQENSKAFLFRLSIAGVNEDGPFSIFPSIDRTLFLVSGHGMILESTNQKIHLNQKWQAFHFAGEDAINCRLINGPCQDFNVMVDRNFAKAQSSTILTTNHRFNCASDMTFIYDTQKETLTILEKEDKFHFISETQTLLVICNVNRI